MSQQPRQKFQRTSRSRKLSKDPSIDQSLVKNSIVIQQKPLYETSMRKKSQVSIDDGYQFVIKTKEGYQNLTNISHFFTTLKSILHIKQLKAFYKIKMSFIQKKHSTTKALPYLLYLINSIKTKHQKQLFMRLKLNLAKYKIINTHFKHLSLIQKNKTQQYISTAFSKLLAWNIKIKKESLFKEQTQMNKMIQIYQENESLLSTITQKFSSPETLSKELTQINRRAGRRKAQFPYTFITQLIAFTNQQKKNSIEFNSSLKALALLYGRKNLTGQTFLSEKAKIDEKYSSCQLYTNAESQLNLLIKNVMEKERHFNEVELKKFRNENQKLSRQLEAQRSKSPVINSSQSSNSRSRKESLLKSQDCELQNIEILKQKNSQLQRTVKEYEQKIKQLEVAIEVQELNVLQQDLVKQTLEEILQKIESGNSTWSKDVQVLKNGPNYQKYKLIYRITDLLRSQTIESKLNLSPDVKTIIQYANEKTMIEQHLNERISWDLSSRVNYQQIDHPQLPMNSLFLLAQNDDQSELLSQMMRESNLLLDFDNDNVKATKRLSFPLKQQQQQRLYHQRTTPTLQPSSIVSIQQMQQLNSILVRIMSQQFSLTQMKQHHLPNLLKNSYFANLVIMIESYLTMNQKLSEVLKEKESLQIQLKESEMCVVNERKLREWIEECVKEMENDNNNNNDDDKELFDRIKNNERYWQQKMEEKGLGCIIVMELVRLMKKYAEYMKSHSKLSNLLPIQQHQHLHQQKQLRKQLEHQEQLVQSLSLQLKQNQAKHRQQLSYYHRLQEQSYHNQNTNSPSKHMSMIERSIRKSRSVKSIRSNQSSVSQKKLNLNQSGSQTNSNNKLQEVKSKYKQTIEQMSIEQKKLLQQIESLNIQKSNLLQLMSIKDITILNINQTISQLNFKLTHTQRELSMKISSQMQVKQKYQQQFLSLRQDLQKMKQQITKQVQLKQHQVIYYRQAYDVLLKKYQQLQQHQQHQQHYIRNSNRNSNNNASIQTQIYHQQSPQSYIQIYHPSFILKTQLQNTEKQQRSMIENNKRQQNIISNHPLLQFNTPIQIQTQITQMDPTTSNDIKHVDENTYLVTQHSISQAGSADTYKQISQVEQLRMQIRQLQQERNHVIQSQVLKALKSQQQEFNNFYRQNMIRMEEHFINQVLPLRVKQAQMSFSNSYSKQQIQSQPPNSQSQQSNSQSKQPLASGIIPSQFTQQQYLHQKYEQWRRHYQQQQLQEQIQKRITQNNDQWEREINVKMKQINAYWQQQISNKIREVESYWQTVALPAAINSQLNQWNTKQQQIIQMRIHQVESYWQKVILPQRIQQYQQNKQHNNNKSNNTQNNPTVLATASIITYSKQDLERILADERLRLKREFDVQLQKQLNEQQDQWRISILPKLKLQWQSQYQQQSHRQQSPPHQQRQLIQQTLTQQLSKLQQQLNALHSEQIRVKILQVQQYWQHALQAQRVSFNQALNKSLQARTIEIETYWQTVMIPQIRTEWERTNSTNTKTNDSNIRTDNVFIINKQQIISQYINSQQFASLIFNKRQEWTLQRQQQQRLRTTQQIKKYSQKLMQYEVEIERLKLKERSLEKMRVQIQSKQQQIVEYRKALQQRNQNIKQLQSILQQNRTYISNMQIQVSTLQSQRQSKQQQQNQSQHQQQHHTVNMSNTTIIKQQQVPGVVSLNQTLSLSTKQAIYKLQTDYMRQLGQNKQFYEEKLAMVEHQKMLLVVQLKQLQGQLNKVAALNNTITNNNSTINTSSTHKQSIANIATIQNNYQKQLLSLESTIKNKQSQMSFIKRSMQSLTLENQQLHQRLSIINNKNTNLQASLQQSTSKGIKLEYQIKYLREKEAQLSKKLQSLSLQLTDCRSKAEQQKLILQKKFKQLSSTTNQQQSLSQLKITQLQSQLTINLSTIKNLQYQLQRKKKQFQESIQNIQKIAIQSNSYKQTIKQHQYTIRQYQQQIKLHESTIQDLRLEIRKSCDQINRQKNTIANLTNNLNHNFTQNNNNNKFSTTNQRSSSMSKQHSLQQHHSQLQSLIIQIERLRLDNYRLKQRLLQSQSLQNTQIHHLKTHIQQLQHKLYTSKYYQKEGDVTEIEILKKINAEISQLVSSNKQLQLRVILLEKEKQLSAFGISIERFFIAFQQQMDHLINYLISNQLFRSDLTLNSYHKFQQKSRQALSHGYVEDYFRQWQTFMRGIVEENLQQYKQNIQLHNTNQVNNNSQKEDQTDDIIEKYDTVLNDIKFTLTEYIKTGDTQLLSLMARSLGVDMESNQHGELQNEKNEIQNGNERTLVRQ